MDNGGESSSEDSPKLPSSARKQWRRVILGSIALQRWQCGAEASDGPVPEENVAGGLDVDMAGQNGVEIDVPSPNGDGQMMVYKPPIGFLSRRLTQKEIHRIPRREMNLYLQNVRGDLIKQINSYSLVLTVLITITFVASLQPPGSYNTNKGEEGKELPSSYITGFMFFATLSFLFACIGVCTGVVGSITLLRPGFFSPFPALVDRLDSARSPNRAQCHPSQRNGEDSPVIMDPIDLLGELILDNLCRVRRLAVYMSFSLSNCVMAFILAGVAVLDPKDRQRYIALIVAITIGGSTFIIESLWTASGLATIWRHKEMRNLKGLRRILYERKSQHY